MRAQALSLSSALLWVACTHSSPGGDGGAPGGDGGAPGGDGGAPGGDAGTAEAEQASGERLKIRALVNDDGSVIVDEDINPRDPGDVLWAMGTRCDPATTINVLNGTMGSALDPRIPPDKKERRDYTASQAVVLACKPYDWYDAFPKTNVASAALRSETMAKWKELF